MTRGNHGDGHIEIRDVAKTFPGEPPMEAVAPLDLTIEKGEFVSLLGPSGCGKTTLLMMVAGLVRPSSGSVTIDGIRVQRPYTDLGIVFQRPVLADWRTVLENVLLQIEIRGGNRGIGKRAALQLLQNVGLEGFENKYPYELSGGMQQRVALCRALVHDPPILLMDEPFGALDELTRDQLNVDLQLLWQESNKTIVFVTHSIAEAVFLSDRVVVTTPRPATIHEIFEIDLPRPRMLSLRFESSFLKYVSEISAIFRRQGVLRDVDVPSSLLKSSASEVR